MIDFKKKILDFEPDQNDEINECNIFKCKFTNLTPESIKYIKYDLLTTLNISIYSLSDNNSLKLLCNFLEINKTIKHISLESNNLRDEGAIYLSDLLTKNNTIKTLVIGGNNITNIGLNAFTESLKVNKNLKQFIAVNNNFTAKSIIYFLNTLKLNKSIHKLMLGCFHKENNNSNFENHLLDCVFNNDTICYIDLINSVTEDNIKKDIVSKLNYNNNIKYTYDKRFIFSINEFILKILIPLKNYEKIKNIPNDITRHIFCFLGVSFNSEVKEWKCEIWNKLIKS